MSSSTEKENLINHNTTDNRKVLFKSPRPKSKKKITQSKGNKKRHSSKKKQKKNRKVKRANTAPEKNVEHYCSERTIDDFEKGPLLGQGNFGQVYMARELRSKFIVALKVLYKEKLKEAQQEYLIKREIEIQSSLNHPHINRLYDYFYDKKNIYIVLEYAPGGSVFDALLKSGKFTPKRSARYISQLCDALDYLHTKNIVHRDIKPENLLLTLDDEVIIADFGWSVTAGVAKRHTLCGTPDYLAPEMIYQQGHDKSLDIWCLGILLFEFLTGNAPFAEGEERKTYLRIVKHDIRYPSSLSAEAVDLIELMLQENPGNRIPVHQIPQHPFITQYIAL
eukprot:TRINITY_DN3821_c0_g1_i1.p1 TRINITY_DN3821_c0_g1~~TRINITY_DN3821_c0_g1_i1.p1  ORF type:complete len:336 (-),score=62.58 TRINITY_DN3821_c0_g1_i1:170-1177(-)